VKLPCSYHYTFRPQHPDAAFPGSRTEPYHAYYLEVQPGLKEAGGNLKLYCRQHREREGLNASGGWYSWNTPHPLGSTHLLDQLWLTIDDDTNSPLRKRGFYIFSTILTLEQAKNLIGTVGQEDSLPLLKQDTCATDESALREIISSSKLDRNVYCSLAKLYADKGELDKIPELVAEFSRQYAQCTASDSLGNIYKAGGIYERAIDAYKQVLALKRDTGIQLRLMECYEKIGKLDKVEAIRSQLSEHSTLLLGLPAPKFCLKGVTGRKYRLSDFRGKVVLLNFFYIPSGCMQAMSAVERLHQKYKEKGVTVLGLTKETDVTKVTEFMRYLISYPVLVDAEAVANEYGAGSSSRYIIDQTGIVRHRGGGVYGGMVETLVQKLNSLLKQHQRKV